MPKYNVQYSFEGKGSVFIEANSEDEAREKFYDGEFENEYETCHEFNVTQITLE